jgi:hypothetical protein
MDSWEVLSHRGSRTYVKVLGTEKWVLLLPGQRVRIEGRNEEFLVLQVDQNLRVAQLLRTGSVSKVLSGISIALMCVVSEPYPEDHWPEAA